MSADIDIDFGIFTEAHLRISQRTIYTFLICVNQLLFGQSPPKSPRPTHKKIQFYNRPTVHSRFQSVFPQQTPSKPTARHHVAAEQEAQDFRPRRPALTLLTP